MTPSMSNSLFSQIKPFCSSLAKVSRCRTFNENRRRSLIFFAFVVVVVVVAYSNFTQSVHDSFSYHIKCGDKRSIFLFSGDKASCFRNTLLGFEQPLLYKKKV